MPISPKHLAPGEHIILTTRTHWKVLILPALALIATCAVGGYLLSVLPSGSLHTPLAVLVILLMAVEIIGFSLRRLILWISASYTLTNRRLINRSGIFVRRGVDIPLQRINQVNYERGLVDRIFGCGTLRIADASEAGSSVLLDVPHVEDVQVQINHLVFDEDGPGGREEPMPPTTTTA